jgi:hypothetical protein
LHERERIKLIGAVKNDLFYTDSSEIIFSCILSIYEYLVEHNKKAPFLNRALPG